MTISTTIIKSSYSGNGSTSAFTYNFKITDEDDIQVIIRSANGNETVKTITTHYTVSGVGGNSGTVTFTSGNIPVTGETVVLRRSTPQTQAMDLIDNDPMNADTIETAHDKITSISQELQEQIDRSLKISRTNTMTSTEFTVDATNRAGKVLGFDNNGELNVTSEIGNNRGNWSASTTYAIRDIVKDTSTNNIFMANTVHTSSGSEPLTTNTDSAKWDLLVDAESATTAQNAAAASATAASNSAAAALVSENNSATSETNSANSATASANSATSSASSATASASSATSAAGSASAAEATLDLFDDSYLGSKTSNPTLDNDGNALQDGALYFDTTNNVMKVYDLASTTWLQLTPTVSNQNNINSAVANSTNINAVAANETNINAVNSNSSNINTVASISSDVTSVAGISSEVTSVNSNSTNINAVNSNSTNINTVAAANTNINSVATNISSINTAANNLSDINAFANIYLGPSASAPTQDPDGSALDNGDLYFDTSSNQLKVYGSSGWQNAGSSVNGTSARFKYTATASQTTFTGNDDAGNNLSFDPLFCDVYLNGVKLVRTSDYNDTSGSSIVLTTGAALNDVLEIVAFGTFTLSNITLNDLTDVTTGGVSDGQVLQYSNSNSQFEPVTLQASDITTEGNTFSNYNSITSNATTTLSATKNHFLYGPITVASGVTWTVSGSGTLNII